MKEAKETMNTDVETDNVLFVIRRTKDNLAATVGWKSDIDGDRYGDYVRIDGLKREINDNHIAEAIKLLYLQYSNAKAAVLKLKEETLNDLKITGYTQYLLDQMEESDETIRRNGRND